MGTLNKAKRYRLSVWMDGCEGNQWADGEMEESQHGSYIYEDDPILLAMERVCEAVSPAIQGLEYELGHLSLMANFGELVAAFDALRALTEKTHG